MSSHIYKYRPHLLWKSQYKSKSRLTEEYNSHISVKTYMDAQWPTFWIKPESQTFIRGQPPQPNNRNGLIQVKEEVWTGFFKGFRGISWGQSPWEIPRSSPASLRKTLPIHPVRVETRNVCELWDINCWGPIVDILKFMSYCDKSRHKGLGLGIELTD